MRPLGRPKTIYLDVWKVKEGFELGSPIHFIPCTVFDSRGCSPSATTLQLAATKGRTRPGPARTGSVALRAASPGQLHGLDFVARPGSGSCSGTENPKVLQRFAQASAEQVNIRVHALDIARDPSHDLLQEQLQRELLDKLRSHFFQAVVMSPPCATWSRAPWANSLGPRPLRSSAHPWRYPWLEGDKLRKVEASNLMIQLCLQVITICLSHNVYFILEHPEDLGASQRWGRLNLPGSSSIFLPFKPRFGQVCLSSTCKHNTLGPCPTPAGAITLTKGSSNDDQAKDSQPQQQRHIHPQWTTGWLHISSRLF